MSLELYGDEKFNYLLEIDIIRNCSQKTLVVLRGAFLGFGCPKRHPDALLAKTMAMPMVPADRLLKCYQIGKIGHHAYRDKSFSILLWTVVLI